MNRKNELLATIWSVVAFTLTLIGIAGLSWGAFSDDGWVERSLDVIWEAEVRSPLLMTPVILGGLYLVFLFLRGSLAPGRGNPLSNLLVYAMMVAGAYYSYVWFIS